MPQESPVSWNIFASAPGSAAIFRAGKQVWKDNGVAAKEEDESAQLLGWESPGYGDLRPAVSVTYQIRSRLPVRFVTAILLNQRCKIKSEAGQLVILRTEPGNQSEEIYRVNFLQDASAIVRQTTVLESVLTA
jgi:hypothetical protein